MATEAEETAYKKRTEEALAKYEAKIKNEEEQKRQRKKGWDRALGRIDKGGKPVKKESIVKRVARGIGTAAENVGPNPFGRTETRGKKGTTRTTGFVPPSINSGFSAGGFPSMESGFGSSLAPKFPAFGVGGGKKGGTGLGSMSLGFPSFGGTAPARRPKRRKRKRKR